MTPPVTVIVPARNAADTIMATVASVQAQTFPDFEMIVVDDGSDDATPDLVESLAARDARIRLVRQDQAEGVSAARNRALSLAGGRFIAPLDADDLWHPEKLARQVAALEGGPAAVALVYSWFRRIDEGDHVYPGSPSPVVEGAVFHRHLDRNFISCGSTLLMRAEAARAFPYDAAFARCEDYLFQLRLARHYEFACVPGYLTGYRRRAGSLSTHVRGMIDGHLAMYAAMAGESPDSARPVIARRRAQLQVELARNRMRRGEWPPALAALRASLQEDPAAFAGKLWTEARATLGWIGGGARMVAGGRRFESYAPDEPDGVWKEARSPRRDRRLAVLDAPGLPGQRH